MQEKINYTPKINIIQSIDFTAIKQLELLNQRVQRYSKLCRMLIKGSASKNSVMLELIEDKDSTIDKQNQALKELMHRVKQLEEQNRTLATQLSVRPHPKVVFSKEIVEKEILIYAGEEQLSKDLTLAKRYIKNLEFLTGESILTTCKRLRVNKFSLYKGDKHNGECNKIQ
jgi:uncharacterized protein YoxC